MENPQKKTNRLIHSLSPYLLQHAHNPVDWYEWGEEAFEKAKKENKLLLVSIGYSACHWCHVMAHESFEDEATAEIMNAHYVCIKIDREEFPDIDHRYMDACQLINNSGGWPLNAIALPDQRPIHALTYLPKPQWQQLLQNIEELWRREPEKARDYADKLEEGLVQLNKAPLIVSSKESKNITKSAFTTFAQYYDVTYGGINRAPKFPMPANYRFLLSYGVLKKIEPAKEMALFTLKQMALGGIYDVVDGGFARYSVDERWFAPHFEKMLYDNAQLIGLYSYAFAHSGNPLYKKIALQTIAFCKNEMQSPEGLYYAAYDADSEGIEGLYYTYTYEELQEQLGKNATLFCQYFQCTSTGNWEHSRNILFAIDTLEKAAKQYEIDASTFTQTITDCLEHLKQFRSKRIAPGLDDKHIGCWNNLMLKGLSEASLWLDEPELVRDVEMLAGNILSTYYNNGELKRIAKKGNVKIAAYLEDCATLTDGLIAAYQTTFNETYLLQAFEICTITLAKFFNAEKQYFEFSEIGSDKNGISKFPLNDDVICSGNSIMAHNLWRLSWYFDKPEWQVMARNMLSGVQVLIEKSAPWYSNWAALQLMIEEGTRQIILSGHSDLRHQMPLKAYAAIPNAILGFAGTDTQIPLFKDKLNSGADLVFNCTDHVCQLPVKFI
ncbi:MAG: thioredoxin domain-containing protein [Bacteroidota bacterium]